MSTTATYTPPKLDAQWILDNLISQDAFEPVPHPTKNRKAWQDIAKTSGKTYVDWAEEHMDYAWPQVLATQLIAYGRHASRVAMEQPYFERRMALQYFVMAECLTMQGKYLDKIVDGIWAICEETYWCLPPHMGASKDNLLPDVEDPILDLFASYTGQQMAWTVWLLGDQLDAISPEIGKQIRRKVRYFVLDAILDHPRHWLGRDPDVMLNNWTPWICATWLSSIWILEDDSEKFNQAMGMLANALNVFMKQHPQDGGCDEGVMYWTQAGGALYECLSQLGGMTGSDKALLMDHPLLLRMAQYPQVMHVMGKDYACFADGRAYATMPGYWISKWAEDLDDASLKSFGNDLTHDQNVLEWSHLCNFYRQIIRPFMTEKLLTQPRTKVVAERDHYLPDIQVMTARSCEQSGKGWHVSAKGGHNAESHNHNDIGQYVVYRDGHPLLIDLGVETYSARTFSPQRYEIFTMQSQWHNLPSFGDAVQLPGRTFAARDLNHQVVGDLTTFTLDIAKAYDPACQLKTYLRQIQLDRQADHIIVTDAFELGHPQPMTMSLVTTSKVIINNDELIFETTDLPHGRKSANAVITWQGVTFDHVNVEDKAITDEQLQSSWGDSVRRVQLTVNQIKKAKLQLTIKPV
ncbi:MAG TPA: hypothetical protein DCM28_04935 [Phycisphaerales bacterium]|nr:hypothetical protein [Phycisphaerales bacterium]HCD32589.1 hypothetical protein [Phycisphaerales bacterium]|tara:strand:- start:2388 stop:4289 length:1902 start_codon:yes stop_codon:yes gene_type:complete